MLQGSTSYTVDDRHRIVLPRSLASQLSEDIVVALGPERNLLVYSQEAWQDRCGKVKSRSMDKVTAMWQRYFVGNAQKVELDKHQRFVVPERLRELTGIAHGAEVVVMGTCDRAEVWQKADWEQYMGEISTDQIYEVIAEIEGAPEPWSLPGIDDESL